MSSKDLRMRLHSVYVGRLRRSTLRAEFHERVAQDAAVGFEGGWVVDIGCGPGLLEARLGSRLRDGRLVGVDMDRRMLSIASRQQLAAWVHANAAWLPLSGRAIALVVSTASLKDWGDPVAGLREIARVVRPGGRALVFDFLTAGPESRPGSFVRRFGIVSWILGRAMGVVRPFRLGDARRIAEALQDVADVDVRVWEDIGVVRLEIRPRGG